MEPIYEVPSLANDDRNLIFWHRNNHIFAFVKVLRNLHGSNSELYRSILKFDQKLPYTEILKHAFGEAIKEYQKYKANLEAELSAIKTSRESKRRSFDVNNPSDMYGFELVASNNLYAKKLKAVKEFRINIGVSGRTNTLAMDQVKKNLKKI